MTSKESCKHSNLARKESAKISQELWQWFCKTQKEAASGKCKLTKKAVQAKARLTYQRAGIHNFLASDGWYRQWKSRWEKLDNQDTTDSNETTSDVSSISQFMDIGDSFNLSDVLDSVSVGKDPDTSSTSSYVFPDFYHLQPSESLCDSYCFNNNNVRSWSELTDFLDTPCEVQETPQTNNNNSFNLVVEPTVGEPTVGANKKNTTSPAIKKGQCYLPKFKEKVLEYAATHSFKQTAVKFKINCNTITEWVRENKRLQLKTSTITTNKTDNKQIDNTVDVINNKTDVYLSNDVEFIQHLLTTSQTTSLTSDQLFLNWLKLKRKNKTQLDKMTVYNVAKYCLNNINIKNILWFKSWINRIDEVLNNTVKLTYKTEAYIKYPNDFKIEVALYAKTFTKNSAARIFNISRRRIFDWFNNLQHDIDDKYQLNTSKSARNNIEVEIYNWYLSKVMINDPPTGLELKVKGKELFNSNGFPNTKCSEKWLKMFCLRNKITLKHFGDDELVVWILSQFDNNKSLSHQNIIDKADELINKKKFKATKSWTLRFLKRHKNLLQCTPTINDSLPESIVEQVSLFRTEFSQTHVNITLGNIVNMDEIPISFLYQEEGKPEKKIQLLRKTGFEHCHAIVLLAVTADQHLLQPAVVLKGLQDVVCDAGDIFVFYRKTGLVDADLLLEWTNRVFLRNVSSPSLLLLDSFDVHQKEELKQLLIRHGSSVMIIPDGATSQLQPLSTGVSDMFQKYMNQQWLQFSRQSSNHYAGKCQCPCDDIILSWITSSYQKLEEYIDSITNSFSVTKLI